MICISCEVKDSTIPFAGKGLFSKTLVAKGKIMFTPTHIQDTVAIKEILENDDYPHAHTSVRWYEDQCILTPELPDDYYINHSFSPNMVWHLGFIFALREIQPGEELFIDYRHILGHGVEMEFLDSVTQQPIIGFSWKESLIRSTEQVLSLAQSLS